MTFSVWLSLFTICLLGAMSPGPSLVMVLKHSLASGRLNGLATAWAHACGIGIYACLTIFGLSIILHQVHWLFLTISYAGATYLAFLGWKAIQSRGGIVPQLESPSPVSLLVSVREGALISLFNPKIALFFTALFSQFISIEHEFSSQVIIVATPLIVDGLWYTAITLLVSNRVVFDVLKTKVRLIDKLSGAVLIALACRVMINA
jgi:threonine/homoserine/homoserine lactone efflux protein